jgi:hypothetical protein
MWRNDKYVKSPMFPAGLGYDCAGIVDAVGKDVTDFAVTGGEVSDSTQLKTSLDIGPDITPRAAITDKGYDSAKTAPSVASDALFQSFHTVQIRRAGRTSFQSSCTRPELASNRPCANLNDSNGSRCAVRRPPKVTPLLSALLAC